MAWLQHHLRLAPRRRGFHLITPDIEAGNILYKALVHFAGFEMATAVLGVKVPCVVPSRADSSLTKLYSIALAVMASRR